MADAKISPKIFWTMTDEAPALATYSFLPIVSGFTTVAGIDVELKDISLSGRVLSQFPDYLKEDQRVVDALAELGELTQVPEANIIKLPNISASVPQLKACVKELQGKGFALPDYPEAPKDDAEKKIQSRYKKCMGSAVNPVLREGNSDRRAPKAVKEFARQNPHRLGAWSKDSKTHVATMDANDFAHNEKSVTIEKETTVDIEFVSGGNTKTLKKGLKLQAGEIIDGTFMSKAALIDFLTKQIADAKEQDILFSLHMKATMMKVSDPIIFGHAVKVFFKNVFDKHGADLEAVGANVNNGFGDLLAKIENLDAAKKDAILASIKEAYANGPSLAMVDSDKGITNLHVPSDVIIDASMPAMLRDSGCMWNTEGKLQACKAVIPDSSYAPVYQAVVDFCKENGAFDVKTMGSSPNVGLMAQKAQEYGSHDKTFEVEAEGTMRIVDADGKVLMEFQVGAGDVWRACQVKDAPVRDWVKLAVTRARDSNTAGIFWLDEKRAHDSELIKKVNLYLKDHDTNGLDLSILDPAAACKKTCEFLKAGKDCISITGNVLRDYNTDLFPIIEVGTSAKMLSIVPLMKGGGLFETGAGGSAPKHVQQFTQEGHLRWDSLGEFLALGVSLIHLSNVFKLPKAKILGESLDKAATEYLLNNKIPSRKAGGRDNRGTHFYVAMYWAQALAAQDEDADLKAHFGPIAEKLAAEEDKINAELLANAKKPCDIGGYYLPDFKAASAAMRPSATLNAIVDALGNNPAKKQKI